MSTATQTFDDVDQALLSEVQKQVPIDHRPFELLGRKLDIGEQECLKRIERLKERQAIRQICAIFDARALGYQRTLAAMRLDPGRVDEAAQIVQQYPGVSYTCKRNDPFNLWLTLAVPPADSLEHLVNILSTLAKAEETILLPVRRLYKSTGRPDRSDALGSWEGHEDVSNEPARVVSGLPLSEQDIRLIRIFQEDLPLIEMPFAVLASQVNTSEEELFAWARKAQHQGSMRRFAAIVHDDRSDLLTSALVVWQLPPDLVDAVAEQMVQFREVSRCERRPVYPSWPYPLFTTIQAKTFPACMDAVKRVEQRVGQFPHKNLSSAKEYERGWLQYFSPEFEEWWKRVGLPAMSEVKYRGKT